MIPQFLLWGVQMKTKTKRQLNAIFYLGLITLALSIGRAATIDKKLLTADTTCESISVMSDERSLYIRQDCPTGFL